MCSVGAFMVASSLFSTGLEIQGAVQAGKQAKDNYEAQQKNIAKAAGFQFLQIGQQAAQEGEAGGAEAVEIARQSARGSASVTTAAGEAGVSGNVVQALLQDFAIGEGRAVANIAREKEFRAANAYIQAKGVEITAQQRLDDAYNVAKSYEVSPGASLVKIGTAFVSSYAFSQAEGLFDIKLGDLFGGGIPPVYGPPVA